MNDIVTVTKEHMTANPVDIHVGKRLRLRRGILGMSQENLAEILGITFQQVQKYEKGINRISASRLFEIAKALNVKISFFFEGFCFANLRFTHLGIPFFLFQGEFVSRSRYLVEFIEFNLTFCDG